MANSDRIRFSYDALRNGFKDGMSPIPPWEEAPSWVRDVIVVTYLQGKLDATDRSQREIKLIKAAKGVLAFDWSGNDEDAVYAIDGLMATLQEVGVNVNATK